MTRKPESKSFLAKAGFEKRDPAQKLGFFVILDHTVILTGHR